MESAFDNAAITYDDEFTHGEIGRRQRAIVWQYLQAHLPSTPLRILELNCGTGEDAVWLAEQGHEVVATDASLQMVQQTKAKAAARGATIEAFQMPFEAIASTSFQQGFDLVFSNFGGLNCIDSLALKSMGQSLKSVLQPGGRFIAVVMPSFCWMESNYFFFKLQWGKVFRRAGGKPVVVHVNGTDVHTWYYSPRAFKQAMLPSFRCRKQRPVGLFIPPSYLEPYFKKRLKLLNFLEKCERSMGASFMAGNADHYLIDLEVVSN